MRTMSKTSSWAPSAGAAPTPWRALVLHVLAALLRAASDALDRHAERTKSAAAVRSIAASTVEFHPVYRDAGAPEGAIYVDGELVGVLPGVTRL